MKNAVTTLALLAAMLPAMAASSIKATVNGMVCDSCAQDIEKRIAHMDTTKEVYVDLKKKTVAIEAKDGQILDGKAITAEIVDAGYAVVKLETVPLSVAQIKNGLKGRK